MEYHFGKYPTKRWYHRLLNIPDLKQPISVHVDRWDIWSVDHTVSSMLVPLLHYYRENYQGVPYTDDEDVPEHLQGGWTQEEYGSDMEFELMKNRWNWVVDEMIWAFEYSPDVLEELHSSGEMDLDLVDDGPPNESGTIPVKVVYGPNHTHTTDEEALNVDLERANNGRRLFAKYFHHLWT